MKTKVAGTSFISEWFQVKGGKIASIRVVFDARPFAAMFAKQAGWSDPLARRHPVPGNAHFGRGLFAFLTELRAHNDRKWFQANKARYEKEVRDPFLRFIADLRPRLEKLDRHFIADPRPVGGSMMRIHRDIRFSKDKSPYKTAVAAHFPHAKGREGATPAYYLQLELRRCSTGGGVWHPEPGALKRIREAIADDPRRWQRIRSGRDFRSTCGMAGESLKRPPSGFDPQHPFIDDIKRKDFAFSAPLSERDVCAKDFLDQVIADYRTSAPFMRFLSEAVGLP